MLPSTWWFSCMVVLVVFLQYEDGWVESSTATICGTEYGNSSNFCVPHCGPSAAVPSFKVRSSGLHVGDALWTRCHPLRAPHVPPFSLQRDTWGYFSAVCFIHGLQVFKATGRPQVIPSLPTASCIFSSDGAAAE